MVSSWTWVELGASLVCLGTWPALLELARRPRKTTSHERCQHVCFLDYALSYGVFGLVLLVAASGRDGLGVHVRTIGGTTLCLVAALGGALLQTGNSCMQEALALGCPLTTLLPLEAALCVVIGTTANFSLQPERSDPRLLFSGVALYLVAILSSTGAQLTHQFGGGEEALRGEAGATGAGVPELEPLVVGGGSVDADEISPDAIASFRDRTSFRERGRSQRARTNRRKGLMIGVLGGVAFGFFTPAFNIAVNDPFSFVASAEGPHSPLSVTAANMIFALSFTASAVLSQSRSLLKKHEKETAASILRARYLGSGGVRRAYAILSGIFCCLGNFLQFHGGKLAGFAAADVVQAFPLVGTLWGVLLFQDYNHANRRTIFLLSNTYLFYSGAVALLGLSAK
ncbi:ureide permease [Chloropicon primus]|uniref:Ureide permease n=2 Tax=Chloropicon primus TaxID=1764295 RepID=A0A5B8MN96_9CHLO|nr:ureide permease [Chloropicon primus]UPR01266.1 ureide permease [Chloropicon primus]|eukprot:QDZ22046.1 ureide permease [Chloropicon primus]